MIRRTHRDRPSEAELAALADGSLPDGRRARVEAAVAASPELQQELRLQRFALQAVDSAAGERAPSAVRARVALARPPRRRARPLGALAASGVATIAAVVAGVAVLAGGTAAPSVADASVLGGRPAVAGVSKAGDRSSSLNQPQAAGLRFPSWRYRFGWRAVGSRTDTVGGRHAVTVFYRRGAERVAYTIVDGAPLALGARAASTTRQGVVFHGMRVGSRRIVTWVRSGHTCIVSATSTGAPTLIKLAGWHHGGAASA